jgi:hypothetical protein
MVDFASAWSDARDVCARLLTFHNTSPATFQVHPLQTRYPPGMAPPHKVRLLQRSHVLRFERVRRRGKDELVLDVTWWRSEV